MSYCRKWNALSKEKLTITNYFWWIFISEFQHVRKKLRVHQLHHKLHLQNIDHQLAAVQGLVSLSHNVSITLYTHLCYTRFLLMRVLWCRCGYFCLTGERKTMDIFSSFKMIIATGVIPAIQKGLDESFVCLITCQMDLCYICTNWSSSYDVVPQIPSYNNVLCLYLICSSERCLPSFVTA